MRPVGHAIVMGASMGGLLAARALADRCQRVTVLERDALPDGDEARKGVPQGRHAHGLLARGREVLEELFPGLTAELTGHGALLGDLGSECIWFADGGCLSQRPTGLLGLLVSRPALERAVRRRVASLPNVEVLERQAVQGLSVSADGRRIDGVRLSSSPAVLGADLVVDASGRGSRSPAWLEAVGFEAPEEEEVRVGIAYASRVYRRRPGELGGKRAVVVAAGEPDWRSAVALAQEGDRWIVSLGGYLGDGASLDERGFAEFARSIPVPEIHQIVGCAEPLSEFRAFRYPASVRRRCERLARFPDGYLMFGDALCSFNPVYGQGMTVAALESIALRGCLSDGTRGLARRFFAAAARLIDTPWQIAVGKDLRNRRVEGRRGPALRLLNWYVGRLQVAARRDPVLTRAFLEVANLIAPPTSILRPAMALRVLRGNLAAGEARAGGALQEPEPHGDGMP